VEAVIEDKPVHFAFPAPEELSPPVIAMSKIAVGYGGPPVLRDLNLRLDQEDRIALLGANGNGKSTLAKLLAGRLTPQSGEMHRDRRLRVGYFAQHQAEELDPRGSPLSHIREALPKATETQHRSQLARFGLDADRAETAIGALSGGEKARLLLALCTRDAPQLLILDEPTNHLDIDAREALVKALADFNGAVLLITHDPHMVELIADRLWLVADGTVTQFDGDMDDYRVLLAERARGGASREDAAAGRAGQRRGRAEARVAAAPLRARIKEIETALDKLNKENALIERRLGDPATYARFKPEDITWANTRRAAIAREVETLEIAWLELQEQLETAA